MKSKYKLNDRINKSMYKNIDVFEYNYFLAYEKESKVFQESVKFSKTYKPRMQTYQECLEYDFYDFQLFVELMSRFHKGMGMSDTVFNYLLYAYEDLKLSYRFLYLGYYTTSGFHLRGFFEKNIYWIYYYFIESKRITQNGKLFKLEKIIEGCLKVGELSNKNTDLNYEVYNKYYFPIGEVLKLYKYYSSDFVHDGKPNSNLEFSVDEFKKMYFLIEITLVYIPRFLKVCIGELVEKFWKNKILNPVDGYLFYRNYLQYLFGENKIFSNQYSQVYNLIFDDEFNRKFIKELGIEVNNLFDKEYLREIEISNNCRKKAKGDKDRYIELLNEKWN